MKTIFTINTRDYMLFPVMMNSLDLSVKDMYIEISNAFDLLQKRLAVKNIKYTDLKHALIPNQEKKYSEICLVFDISMISENNYGLVIFRKLLSLLGEDGTYSILCGDCNILNDYKKQLFIRSMFAEGFSMRNGSSFPCNGQYYFIYFNRLTNNQKERIVNGLLCYSWFVGYRNLNECPEEKSYLSCFLVQGFIKCKRTIIAPHPADCHDCENIDMKGYPFHENGFRFVSINEESFGVFLSYKIEALISDKEDIAFSFNALFHKFDTIDKLKLVIDDRKWNEYLTKTGDGKKGDIIEKIGFNSEEKERFINNAYQRICRNYIYNLRLNDYGDLLFNVCVEFPKVQSGYRKTTIALKYHPDRGTIEMVTIT